MRPVLRRPAFSHSRRWLLACALWAVLVARSLALVHGVVHPVGGGVADRAAVAIAASQATSWAAKALGDHDQGSLTCQLLDQLLHDGSCDLVGAPWLPPLLVLALVAVPAGRLLVAVRAGFHARAPPVLI